MEDDICAVGNCGIGIALSACGICERIGVKLLNLHIRIGIQCACTIAVAKEVHVVVCHTDYKTDVVGLCHQTSHIAYQIGSLLLLEHQTAYIVKLDGRIVNDCKLHVRVRLCCGSGSVCKHVAYTDDEIALFINECLNVGNVI